VPLLENAGHEVVGFDMCFFEGCAFPRGGHTEDTIPRDIRHITAEDVAGCDAVIHLAALSNDPLGDLNPDITYSINHRSSVRVAQAAKDAGVERFVFASSCSLYGAGAGLLTEESDMAPVTPYGESKIMAERDISALADDNFSPVYMRNATAYGASPQLRLDIVVNNLTGWAITTGQVRILSDGSPWRPLVHVEDISTACIAALEAPRELIHNQAINIGRQGENYQIRDVAEIVGEAVPGSVVTFAEGGEPDTRNYKVDFSKAEIALPTWNPRWSVASGASQLAEQYRAAGMNTEMFEGTDWLRIKRIRQHLAAGRLNGDLEWVGAEMGR
jgi:nucleoside-diphosphate-sugar epimerase